VIVHGHRRTSESNVNAFQSSSAQSSEPLPLRQLIEAHGLLSAILSFTAGKFMLVG
jgi:hypothetical protein